MATRDRILDGALGSFGTRGYEASSLDAIASELGVRKQTILYYFPSKEVLLEAVIDRSADELSTALEGALVRAGVGWDRVEAVVRSVFRLALRRPELLGLLREVSRLGPPAATRLTENLEPLVKRAREFLEHKDKVLVNVLFRGRELAHIDEGRKVMDEVLQALDDVAKVEKNPSMEGKRMTAIVAPRA